MVGSPWKIKRGCGFPWAGINVGINRNFGPFVETQSDKSTKREKTGGRGDKNERGFMVKKVGRKEKPEANIRAQNWERKSTANPQKLTNRRETRNNPIGLKNQP